jgi:exosortase
MAGTMESSTAAGGSEGRSLPECRWGQLGLHGFVRIAVIGALFCFFFRSELRDLVYLWLDPTWSHGFLIPLFSLYFIHQRRREILGLEWRPDPLAERLEGHKPGRLLANQTRPNYLGLALLLGILAFYVFNVMSPAGYAYLRPLSMIAALGAVVLFLGGWPLLRHAWLPILFLIFAVPLPRRYYVEVTMPMRQMAASVATVLLNLIGGVQATANGATIDIVYRGQPLEPALDVAEACSGMRLLMAFVALGVAMAYLHYRPPWQRAVLLLSTVPIAILSNIIRVTATGLLYVLAGPRYTQGGYHDMLGLAMLPLAFVFYGLLSLFMSRLFVEGVGGEGVIVRRRGG